MKTSVIKTKQQAIAIHLGMDSGELKDYRYQYGHTGKDPVYTVDDYYTATRTGKLPDMERFNWIQVKDDYLTGLGWNIWKA